VRRVAVVGAGLAGLSAARELRAAGAEVTVFEREAEVGGRVRTVDIDGVPVDVGAQFIAAFCGEVLEAARTAGLAAALHPRPPRSAVAVNGAARPLGRARDLVTGDLLSARSRLHLAGVAAPLLLALPRLNPYRLATAARYDRRSAEEFARRWAGNEAAERLFEPLLRGLLYWDPATTSEAVLLAMVAAAARNGSRAFSVAGGLQRLPEALAADVDVRTASPVVGIQLHGTQVEVLTAGESMTVDGVVCATTASVAANLVADLPLLTGEFLRSVSYSRTLVATYRPGAAAPALSGALIYPAATAPRLASVNPADGGLVRVFLADLGDDSPPTPAEILADVRSTGVCTGWTEGAVHRHTWHWSEGLPRFPPGSLRRQALARPEILHPGRITFAGDYLAAPHVEGAVRSGRAAARTLLGRL
jgi:protoporphyrinogen/coproporphyrinogen III oxidase